MERESFLQARDLLLEKRLDLEGAWRLFRWPELRGFNWATDYFDPLAQGNGRTALVLLGSEGRAAYSFAELAERSSRVARFLQDQGLRPGDRILLMLPNRVELFELMLAALKAGAVVIPATTLLTPEDLKDRVERGGVRYAVTTGELVERLQGLPVRGFSVDGAEGGFADYRLAYAASPRFAEAPRDAHAPYLLYFTSGTTSRPKLVLHTRASYPVGHLSTLYWLGIQPGDLHLNISSPGWAKHAWSSFFAPWNAEATVLALNFPRFDPKATLEILRQERVNTLCAPPTVWRMLILEALGPRPEALRELASAGEPLNPEVIAAVERAWGLTIRDGYGQTETTAIIGNPPGLKVKPGSMGKPLPGYRPVLLDEEGREAEEGEIALPLEPRPLGLMVGYLDDPERTNRAMGGGYYRTGDVARRDEEGYFHYIGRADDVFKSSDYRISPFELESLLLEHPYVAEAAVVPSPHPIRGTVPAAYISLVPGVAPDEATARELFLFIREHISPFKRVRRIVFAELPKTISGKIRRVELRALEMEKRGQRAPGEYWEEDFQ